MTVGNPDEFAIESSITKVNEKKGLRGLGLFCLHISGLRYGVHEPDATMLACSFDAVNRRIEKKKQHTATFSDFPDAAIIADEYRRVFFSEDDNGDTRLGVSVDDFRNAIEQNQIVWAPDGDEAFDDRSCVLQFDKGDSVRLVAFKVGENTQHDPRTLRDLYLPQDKYYSTLKTWSVAFETEWRHLLSK